MPSPCSTSLNSDPASLASLVSPGSLNPSAGDSSSGPSATAADSFDNVLSHVDASATTVSNAADDAKDSDNDTTSSDNPQVCAPLNADQLAWLGAMMVQPQAPATPPAPLPADTDLGTNSGPELTLVGANGRSPAEMLASGVDTLEYTVASAQNALVAPSASFAASTANSAANGQAADRTATASDGTTTAADAKDSTADGLPTTDDPQKSTAEQASASTPSEHVRPATLPHASQRGLLRGVLAHAAKFVAATNASQTQDGLNANTTATPATPQNAAGNGAAGEPVVGADAAESTQAAEAAQAGANANGVTLPNAAGMKRETPRVNFADVPANQKPSGEMPSVADGKKSRINVEEQELTIDPKAVGTAAAKWGKTMLNDARNSAVEAFKADTPFLAGSSGIGSGTTSMNPSTPASAPAPTSHAAELVHEIRDIADGLWAIDRNSVEVKFNFGANDRLSVRVEYRAGTVHATFRTDSPDLRDAIAREWQAQTASSDYRPYRVADPVFTGSGFSFAGGDASRQQQQQRFAEESRSFERVASLGANRSAPATTSSSAASPATRPESTGYLHAIV